MIKINKNHGITLTELIVASILVGIIMLGVMAFNVSLTQMESSSSRSTVLAMQSVSILSTIRKDFNLATGDGTNWGIYFPANIPPYFMSIRQDIDGTPDNYDNDKWIVYFWDQANFKLKRCEQTIAVANQPIAIYATPTANCTNSTYTDNNISILANNLVSASFSFSKNNQTWKPVPGSFAPPTGTEQLNGQAVLIVDLTTMYNPFSSDPDKNKNPTYNLKASILSSSHSW